MRRNDCKKAPELGGGFVRRGAIKPNRNQVINHKSTLGILIEQPKIRLSPCIKYGWEIKGGIVANKTMLFVLEQENKLIY